MDRSTPAAVALVLVVLAGCGDSATPTSPPAATASPAVLETQAALETPAPTPSATPAPASASASLPTSGGSVSVPGGASLTVPPGALSAATTVTIAAGQPPDAAAGDLPAAPAGPAWTVDTGGAALLAPVTLTLPFDPAALPPGADASAVLLAYRDDASGEWRPVPATVDLVAGTATALVDHLSTWALFTVDPTMALRLPWPVTDAGGQPLRHNWSGGPHGYWQDANGKGSVCLPGDPCALLVPVDVKSGLDFGTVKANPDGTFGWADWDVHPVAAGTLVYEGSFGTTGFGAGAVVDHGGLFVIYAHMNPASLQGDPLPAAAGNPPTIVTRATKLGSTWCEGMSPCTAKTGSHHLHIELRRGMTVTAAGITNWGTRVSWDGATLAGWTIAAAGTNYYGSATSCDGRAIMVDADTVPWIGDASACGTPAPAPGPTPGPVPVLSGTWVAPKDGTTVNTSKLDLSAKPWATLADVSVTRVVFRTTWGEAAPVKACTATKPDKKGAWACTADLWALKAPLGKLTLTFDVFDDAGDMATAPGGTRSVTYAAPPQAPAAVTLKDLLDDQVHFGTIECVSKFAYQGYCGKLRVTWKWSGPTTGTRVLIYFGSTGFYDCMPDSACEFPTYEEQCKADPEPPVKVAEVDAADGRWQGLTPPPDNFPCISVVARNDAGSSKRAWAAQAS